jgi:hypothetical protein
LSEPTFGIVDNPGHWAEFMCTIQCLPAKSKLKKQIRIMPLQPEQRQYLRMGVGKGLAKTLHTNMTIFIRYWFTIQMQSRSMHVRTSVVTRPPLLLVDLVRVEVVSLHKLWESLELTRRGQKVMSPDVD